MIRRPLYVQKLLDLQDKPFIKVVTGIRRCGKSTLLKLFVQELLAQGVAPSHIIEMNFESLRFREIVDPVSLYEAVRQGIREPGRYYLLLDEIQMVPMWEKAVNSFQVDFDVDLYITGSNAGLLSSELSTLLSGRYVEIRMLPLSFLEFLDFYPFEPLASMETRFQAYLRCGGMPAVAEIGLDHPRFYDIMDGIYSTVILKDVLSRTHLTDRALLSRIVLYLADTIGCLASPNRIGQILASQGPAPGAKPSGSPASRTVEHHIEALQNAYVFYGVERYDIKGKAFLKTRKKYYIVDTGLRNLLLGNRDMDRGHILENVVFLELLRRGYRVAVGRIGEREIDFVAETPDRKVYIQVTESLLGPDVRERELASLTAIPDHHAKIILTMDRLSEGSYEGIRVLHLLDYLLGKIDIL